jgi:hypothetical protein
MGLPGLLKTALASHAAVAEGQIGSLVPYVPIVNQDVVSRGVLKTVPYGLKSGPRELTASAL